MSTVYVPGSCFTDQSVHFWRDALHFFRKREKENKGKIFNARFLIKTTTFIGDIKSINEALQFGDASLKMGYKDYLHSIYGDVVLFNIGPCASIQHDLLAKFLLNLMGDSSQKLIIQLLHSNLSKMDLNSEICVYDLFKRICHETLLVSILGLKMDQNHELVNKIIDLSILHWHGIISLPMTIGSSLGFSSRYKKALDAKKQLITIMERLVGESEVGSTLHSFAACEFESRDVMLDHLVLLTGALIPKACASLLTSFIVSSPNWKKSSLNVDGSFVSEETLDHILAEILRMWPPFVGVRRICTQKGGISIGKYHIPEGRPVMLHFLAAHRDENTFFDADKFDHTRWLGDSHLNPKALLAFGVGPRKCVGPAIINQLFKTLLREFCGKLDWNECSLEDPHYVVYKWLPVSRPAKKPLIKCSRR